MGYQYLTELTKLGFNMYIEEHRYGDGILAGIDFPLLALDKYNYYKRESVHDYIEITNSPGDIEALDAYYKLCDFAKENKAFLFAQRTTLGECFHELDERAALWLTLNHEQQEKLLDDFIKTQQSPSRV